MPTKICEKCEAVISETETTCPSCGINLEELEENIKAVQDAQDIINKRNAKKNPPKTENFTTKESTFKRLARLRKEKK